MREFIRRHLAKPGHVELVTMRGHLVTCGCGEVWKAATSATNSEGRTTYQELVGQRCPSCGKAPMMNTISAPEEWTERVTLDGGGPNRGRGVVRQPR